MAPCPPPRSPQTDEYKNNTPSLCIAHTRLDTLKTDRRKREDDRDIKRNLVGTKLDRQIGVDDHIDDFFSLLHLSNEKHTK
jgi:hypothetical protein